MTISPSEALLELALLDSKALELDRLDIFTRLTNAGLPPEITLRLEELWEQTKVVGKKVINIGRIVIMEIIRFAEENPNLVIGVALGAAIGALVNLVPKLGPVLAPITMTLGAAMGGAVGSRVDRGQKPSHYTEAISQEVIILAKKFFELLTKIFNALKHDFASNSTE